MLAEGIRAFVAVDEDAKSVDAHAALVTTVSTGRARHLASTHKTSGWRPELPEQTAGRRPVLYAICRLVLALSHHRATTDSPAVRPGSYTFG